VARLVEQRHEFLAFLQRRVGNRAVAEDILQEAFARSLDKVGQLAQEESARAWFYRLLRNAVVDHQRRGGAQQRQLDQLARELAAETEPELEQAVCGCVSGVVAGLKPEYAEALRSVEVEGLPVKEFAAAHGISSNNAAVRVFRAREALKAELRRCCGACADDQCRDCTCHAAHDAPTSP
jgi:RNA polymerase sigma-70 factor (ECF subfamily)